ncbi:Retrovirus-related Pol polyprotein from transposon 297 [Anthophora quadrimaculata]
MVDTGSEPNILKEFVLKSHLKINKDDALAISGITDGKVKTYGSVKIQICGREISFQIVPDSFPIDTDGILGSEFCNREVDILYSENRLVWKHVSIPFANAPDIILPPRTSKCIAINLREKHPAVGLVPRIDVAPGVYLGDAIVTNRHGKAYTRIFNTTNNRVRIPTPSAALEEVSLAGCDNARQNKFQSDKTARTDANEPSRAYRITPRVIAQPDTKRPSPHTNVIATFSNSTVSTESSNSTVSTESSNSTVSTESSISAVSTESSDSTVSSESSKPTDSTVSTGSSNSAESATKSTNSSNLRDRCYQRESKSASADAFNNLPAALPRDSGVFPRNRNMFCVKETLPRSERIKQLLRLDHLNAEEHLAVAKLIDENQDLFYLPGDRLGKTDAIEHRIPTINNEPIHVKQYRYPPVHREEISKQITELLENDIIKPSNSPYNSPLWVVPKKPDSRGNKRWRMVIDYRSLNENSIADAYPLPNITEILDQLGSAKYFSTFDLASGFHQIGVAEQDAPKTAFSTPYGHYQFNRMPFGLRNAPSTFQRLMDSVLSGLQGNEMFVYLDDIVIYASSITEHNVKFRKLSDRLRKANLKLQPDKCEFLRTEVAYLGHVIGRDGVKPDPRNVKAVKDFPAPKTTKNIKQFLGLAGYYRRFIPKFSHIAKPLTALLKKDAKFEWKAEQERAFNTLREMLCSEPILQYPDFTKPFIVTTDASGYAVGAVLSQGKIGKDLPIAYASRLLNAAEANYATIEKECLAIMYAVQYFRPYLYGREFTLVTDHRPLVWMHNVKDPSSRLVRWRLKLAEYEYRVIYKEGKTNMNADALSRNPVQILPLTANSDSSDDSALFISPHARCSRQTATETQTAPTTENLPPELSPRPPTSTPACSDLPELSQSQPDDYPTDPLIHSPRFTDPPTERSDAQQTDSDSTSDDNLFISDAQPYTQRHRLLTESRDKLSMRRDHTVIFTTMDGEPIGNGGKEFLETYNIKPKPGIFLCRARIERFNNNSKYIVTLPVKHDTRELTTKSNLTEALKSLADVTSELQLSTINIARESLDDISWPIIKSVLIEIFYETNVKIIVCQGLTRIPPAEEREEIISEYHASAIAGHKGVNKTYSRIREKYYWGSMKADIQKFIQNCRNCQLQKLTRQKTRQPMVLTDTPGAAFDKVSMDIVGPLPTTSDNYTYILTIQDLLTKYSIAAPLRQATAIDVADAFISHCICKHGAPKAVITDQGSHFLNGLFKTIAKRFKITHYKTTAFHPQTNGSIERSHHVLAEYLKQFISKDREWNTWLPLAMFSYNTSVHEGTQFTPHELVYGKLARAPTSEASSLDLADEAYTTYLRELNLKLFETQTQAKGNLEKAKQKYKYYYDRKLKHVNFRVGDKAFLLKEPRKGKFDAQYTGPYEIIEVLSNNNVKIKFKEKSRIVHANKLKPCKFSK